MLKCRWKSDRIGSAQSTDRVHGQPGVKSETSYQKESDFLLVYTFMCLGLEIPFAWMLRTTFAFSPKNFIETECGGTHLYFLIFKIAFIFVYECLPAYKSVQSVLPMEDRRWIWFFSGAKIIDSWELPSWYMMWVLGTKLRSPVRAVDVF